MRREAWGGHGSGKLGLLRRLLTVGIAGVAVIAASTGCGRRPQPNLVIVTIDTCRADHLGAYGYDDIETPNIDRLAAAGVLFEHAFTPVPITLPSHTSILTGTYPQHHGVRDNDMFVDDGVLTLAEVLRGQGYHTAAFVSAYPLHHQFNLAQGFEHYDDDFESDDWRFLRKPFQERFFFDERTADGTTNKVLDWLEGQGRDPVFLWVHYFDPHANYQPPAPFDQIYADRPYDGEIASVDLALGRLLSRLDEQGLWDNTVFVLTADHGEGLLEHGEQTHALLLYDQTLHVPLVVYAPGVKASRIPQMVRTIDIMPTALELLGVEAPDTLQGASLVPLLEGRQLEALKMSLDVYYCYFKYGWSVLRGYRDDTYKLIEAPEPELYNWRDDPAELVNLAPQQPDRVESMLASLHATVASTSSERAGGSTATLDPQMRKRLEALGYIGASSSRIENLDAIAPAEPSPMEMMPVWQRYNIVKTVFNAQKPSWDVAAQELRHILEEDRGSRFYAHYMEALMYLGLDEFDNARDTLEQLYRDQGPIDYSTILELGVLRLKMGEVAGARELFAEAINLRPEEPRVYFYLGYTAEALGDFDQAERDYRQALTFDPEHSQTLTNLGNLLSNLKRFDEAEEYLLRAADSTPYRAEVHYNLGVLSYRLGHDERAVEFLGRAVKIDPAYDLARYGLARALQAMGDLDSARRQVEILLEIGTDERCMAEARSMLAEIGTDEG